MDKSRNLFILSSLFIITSCGGGGGGGGSAPAILAKIASFVSDVVSVEVGSTATLSWSSSDSTSCTASGGWSGTKSTSGSEEVTIDTPGDTSFSLRCTGEGGSSGTSTLTIEGYRNFAGIAADGYISNAQVFVDENDNFTLDDNEARGETNNGGAFGNLKYSNGMLISLGGTDLDSQVALDNLLLTHNLTGHTLTKVITPVTSIASFMTSPSDINTILGIDSSIDISITDPVANKGDGGINDFYYEKGSQLTVLALALQNISNNMNSSSDKSQDYFKAISEELEKEYTSSTSRVDIENKSFITKVIDNVVSAKTISISNDGKESIASALSAVLPYIQVKSTNAISTSIVRFSLSTFQNDIKSLANGTAVAGLMNTYNNDLSNYIATDQSSSVSDIEPDVLLVNDSFATAEDTSINVNVVNNDSFNPNLSYLVTASAPSNGSVSVVDNAITYNPSLNYYGNDSFSYTVTQGSKSGTGNVTMSVSAVDDPPVLSISSAQSVDENTTPSFTVAAAQDVDGEVQTLTMSGTDSESFDLSSSNVLTFKEAPDFETKSSYTVTFTLTDGITEISEDVTFTIIDINEQIGFEVLKQIEVIKTVE
jgi:hypothetical protein